MSKIKLLWLINDYYVNNFKPIYDLANNSTDFEVIVVATNYYLDGEIHLKSKDVFENIVKHGINCIDSYNCDDDSFLNLEHLNPDYIFLNSPYEMYFPEVYSFERLASFGKLCNISYGSRLVLTTGMYDNFFENNSFYKYAWKTFVENNDMLDGINEKLLCFFEVIGNVKLEFYEKILNESVSNEKFTVIWKPRWTMMDSKFTEYVYDFSQFFNENPKINLLVCIHPLFFNRLKKNDSDGEYIKIMMNMQKLDNVEFVEDGDFLEKVLLADVFVGEHSSTLAEFAATGKPIIFIKTDIELNDFGKKIIDNSYVAQDSKYIFETILKLSDGKDPKSQKRFAEKDSYFPNYSFSSNNLLKFIRTDYQNSNIFYERYKILLKKSAGFDLNSEMFLSKPRGEIDMQKDLYTIIIAHYNQMNYIFEALDSVLLQNYPNIELIVIDDCSTSFDKKLVEDYIIKNKRANIVAFRVQQNKKNLGTSMSLNGVLKKSNGKYVHLFAADDALYDADVVTNFVREFEKDEEVNCITTQCIMYDQFLKEQLSEYVNPQLAFIRNTKTAEEQFKEISFGCFYGAGGTAYKNEIFETLDYFDGNYKLVEDWSFWLKLTRNGHKIIYADFTTIKHRDGGVSHSLHHPDEVPPHVKQYYKDILRIYELEILENLSYFSLKDKFKIIISYIDHVNYYAKSVPDILDEKHKIIRGLYLKNFDFLSYKILKKIKNYIKSTVLRIKNLSKTRVLIFVAWFMTSLLVIENSDIEESYYLLLVISVIFLIFKKVIPRLVGLLRLLVKSERRD